MGRLFQSINIVHFNLHYPSLVLTLLVIVISGFSHSVLAKTIVVAQDARISSIKVAIIRAQPGDTILVKEGHYKEHDIIIDKKLTLIGQGLPIIDGEQKEDVLNIQSDSVTIDGFKIIESGSSSFNDIAGIRVDKAHHVTLRNNELVNTFFGILIHYSTHCTIENNKLYMEGDGPKRLANGIHAWKSSHLTIENNTVSGHRDGYYLEFVTSSTLAHNQSFENTRYGLHFMFSHDCTYYQNQITKNGAGVAVMYSRRVKMEDNLFSDNWGSAAYAILLKDINDSEIYNNHFEKNTVGVLAEGSTRIIMKGNEFKNNGWALKIMGSCDNVQVNGNNFIQNTFDIATNTSFSENNFDGNYWDKYEGYDLDRDGVGDIPFRPVSLYSLLIERNSSILMLFRSFFVNLMDRAERALPGLTPVNLVDKTPQIRMIKTTDT